MRIAVTAGCRFLLGFTHSICKLGQQQIQKILQHFLDSNDVSFLPAAGLIDPDYDQIRESREDVKLLSHHSAL